MSLLTELASRIKTKIETFSISLSQIADGLITGAKLVANTITFSKIQQIGAYKTLANVTGSTANLTEVNFGSVIQGAVTLNADVTYAKADFAGRTHLLLSSTGSTRTLTISNTGFVAGDFICLLINQNSSSNVNITIGTRDIWGNRGNIVNALYDGTNWNIWSGGAVFNTSTSAFTNTVFGHQTRATSTNNTAMGENGNASASGATGYGKSFLASGIDTVAFGQTSNAQGLNSSSFGANTNDAGFANNILLGAYARGRRYGALRIRYDNNGNLADTLNPSANGEISTWNGTSTNATITEIFLRGVSSNRCVLQAKNNLKFRGQATAFRSDYSGTAGWDITGIIKRDGSNNTTLVGVTATLTHSDGTGGTLVLTIDADDTNEALRVRVTGNASETWYWLVELELLDLRIA